jgi:hypothetical protein
MSTITTKMAVATGSDIGAGRVQPSARQAGQEP